MKIIVEEIKNKDESFSYSGTKDFIQPEGDIKTLVQRVATNLPRSQKSKNNSYS